MTEAITVSNVIAIDSLVCWDMAGNGKTDRHIHGLGFFGKICKVVSDFAAQKDNTMKAEWIVSQRCSSRNEAYPLRPACQPGPPCRWTRLCSGRSCWRPLWTLGSGPDQTWRTHWTWHAGRASSSSFPSFCDSTSCWFRLTRLQQNKFSLVQFKMTSNFTKLLGKPIIYIYRDSVKTGYASFYWQNLALYWKK